MIQNHTSRSGVCRFWIHWDPGNLCFRGIGKRKIYRVECVSSSHAAKILIRDLVSKMWTTFIVLDDGTPDVKNSVDSQAITERPPLPHK